MITAAEALRLSGAQLTEDERAIVHKLLTILDEEIPKRMKRNGFEFETNNTNAAAMFEVVTILQDHGWIVQCAPKIQQSRFSNNNPMHVGYTLSCSPSKNAIETAKRALQ